MDVFEAIQHRRSVRSFAAQEVEEVKLSRILAVSNDAPSAGDLQSYEIVVIREPERKVALARAAHHQDSLVDAPLDLVYLADTEASAGKYGERGRRLYAIQDATIAAAYAQLGAVAVGLATAWVGEFDERQVRRVVGAPEHLVPVAIIPVGYAAELPDKAPRRRLSSLVHHEEL
ncbi:MAG: nitroreductase [Chloroflexota bacterium]|nr:MAG: nitroreductase [Chloroflexota bacterium]